MGKILYTDLFEYATDDAVRQEWVSSKLSRETLLIHCNGSDGDTDFTDVARDHTINIYGNTQKDTSQKKFGTASALFDGEADGLIIPYSSDLALLDEDFTIDFWIRFNTRIEDSSGKVFLLSSWVVDHRSFNLHIINDSGNYYLRFGYSTNGTDIIVNPIGSSINITTGTWYHIAYTRSGNTLYAFLDGNLVGTLDLTGITIYDPQYPINIGMHDPNTRDHDLDGWMDEIRVIIGQAIWTSNFTPPSSEYTPSDVLAPYSESTIVRQGSYSMKVVAAQTDSLNETLTRTFTDYLDYSIQDVIKFDVRASRTGTNFRIGIHDVGGTTTWHNVNVIQADTWQTETWDISSIPTSDRDQIDKIIIEITNADADNTIYFDNLYSQVIVETAHTWIS